ncbi:hypothetical protein JET18_02805 [Chryseobacterium sp. L7]|uniref:Uncharacterized protein n=1 Tax=Chryseobacterium endalhagicum TaxID=2797638 RepID=A0ABS1QD01_9FLAO|nr:hypothetical protein [Chryseobacterium endalhagicum]MBL1219748.1 hypothetical protein [Chryseobacterium endalhagicum]
MKTKSKKIADYFLVFLKAIAIAAFIIFVAYIENPVRYFFYALFVAILVNFKSLRNLRIDFKNVIQKFSIRAGLIYLFLITVFSVSPFLKIQEFKASHWNWTSPDEIIIHPTVLWDTGYRRKGNSYADVIYKYQYKGTSYKNSESEILKKHYPFWNWKDRDELIPDFATAVSEKIRAKDYILLINPKQPQQSKLFLSSDFLYFQGSLFYDAVTGYAAFGVILICCIAFIYIIPTKNSSPKHKGGRKKTTVKK